MKSMRSRMVIRFSVIGEESPVCAQNGLVHSTKQSAELLSIAASSPLYQEQYTKSLSHSLWAVQGCLWRDRSARGYCQDFSCKGTRCLANMPSSKASRRYGFSSVRLLTIALPQGNSMDLIIDCAVAKLPRGPFSREHTLR